MDVVILYIGRIVFGGYFLYNAYNHFSHLAMMAGYAQAKGVPSPKLAVAGAGVLLGIGGISILLNVFPLVGLLALVLFLIPVTFMVHAYWKVQEPMARMGETVNFAKNLALLGAVLLLLTPHIG